MLRLLSALRAHVFKLQRKERWRRAMLKLSVATSCKAAKRRQAAASERAMGVDGATEGGAHDSAASPAASPTATPALESKASPRGGSVAVKGANDGADGGHGGAKGANDGSDGGQGGAKDGAGERPATGLAPVRLPPRGNGAEAKRGDAVRPWNLTKRWGLHARSLRASRANAMLEGAAARTYVHGLKDCVHAIDDVQSSNSAGS